MDLNRYYNFDWVNPSDAPDDKAVLAASAQLRKEMEGLVVSPLNDPTVGPALLTGRAAAVFFHEVFGHRAEGHRQKDVTEGQTFAKKVGEQIFPDFLTVVDDATKRAGPGDLLGYYEYDDEGVAAQRVMLVDHGVLKNFEMSRSPLEGFPHSNGHGRRQLGASPVSRQGNLMVESSKTLTNAQLRAKLIELVKQQGKPYGLLIDDIAGGFTFTGRGQPQAFQVEPLVVYKVFADGRPDELVRGVDIVGTPLAALTKIVATGDTPEVFNGYCGAESGSVPVSAASPAILTSELEVQKKKSRRTGRPFCRPRRKIRSREVHNERLRMMVQRCRCWRRRLVAPLALRCLRARLLRTTITLCTPCRMKWRAPNRALSCKIPDSTSPCVPITSSTACSIWT